MADVAKIKLQYFRSMICAPTKQKLTIKGLGFTRLNQIIEREDTPWYPTLRLFRQRTAGNWPEVVERVAGELADYQHGARLAA